MPLHTSTPLFSKANLTVYLFNGCFSANEGRRSNYFMLLPNLKTKHNGDNCKEMPS